MRRSIGLITFLLLASCQSGTPPGSEPNLIEPSPFSNWPSVTEMPVQVPPGLWVLCSRNPSPEEAQRRYAEAKAHGPHATCSVIVRVSPEAIGPFREGSRLSTGAV